MFQDPVITQVLCAYLTHETKCLPNYPNENDDEKCIDETTLREMPTNRVRSKATKNSQRCAKGQAANVDSQIPIYLQNIGKTRALNVSGAIE